MSSPSSYSLVFAEYVGRPDLRSKMPLMSWGTKGEHGFDASFLRRVHELHPDTTTLHNLTEHCPDPSAPDAAVLVVHAPKDMADAAFLEVRGLPFCDKTVNRGRLDNAKSRRTCYVASQCVESDATTGQSAVRTWEQLPACKAVRSLLHTLLGDNECDVACALFYPDIFKGGVSWHGDEERVKSLVMRLGHDHIHPLWFRFFKHSDPVSPPIPVQLRHGDIAIACKAAVGTDFKIRSRVTLRHATGHLNHPVPPLNREIKQARESKKRANDGV